MRTGTLDGIIQGAEFQKIYDSGELAAAATSLTISGLNGDAEDDYLVLIRQVGGADESVTYLRLNNDSGNNYKYQFMYGASTSVAAGNGSLTGMQLVNYATYTNEVHMSSILIKAKSGYIRTALVQDADRITGTTVQVAGRFGYVWNNTADNITSIVWVANQTNGLGVGSRIIVLRKNAQAVGSRTGTLDVQGKLKGAFQKIYQNTLGSAATSVTISGLNGNVDVMYKLIIRTPMGAGSADAKYVYINNDSGTNYGYQMVYSTSTTIAGERSTAKTGLWAGANSASGDMSYIELLLYAKSGYIRTALNAVIKAISGTTIAEFWSPIGQVWNNTADNITSLVLASTQTNGFGVGTVIELYAYREQ